MKNYNIISLFPCGLPVFDANSFPHLSLLDLPTWQESPPTPTDPDDTQDFK